MTRLVCRLLRRRDVLDRPQTDVCSSLANSSPFYNIITIDWRSRAIVRVYVASSWPGQCHKPSHADDLRGGGGGRVGDWTKAHHSATDELYHAENSLVTRTGFWLINFAIFAVLRAQIVTRCTSDGTPVTCLLGLASETETHHMAVRCLELSFSS